MASSHGLMPRLFSLVIHPGQQKNSLPKNRILFSDLGNISEIANSLVPARTLIKLKLRRAHFNQWRALCPDRKQEKNCWTASTNTEVENEILQDQVHSISDIIEGEEEDDDEGEG
jgi:hypothetical protein